MTTIEIARDESIQNLRRILFNEGKEAAHWAADKIRVMYFPHLTITKILEMARKLNDPI